MLESVRTEFPTAVIAGGAVRDHFLGVSAKDIDILVDAESADELEQAALRLDGFDVDLLDGTEYEEAPDWVRAVRGVLDGTFEYAAFLHDIHVQIIARPDKNFSGETLVANFDFALTKCWFDGETVHCSPEAQADRTAKTVTLTRWNSPEHVEISYQRFRRFNERMGGGWTFVDPRTGASGSELQSGAADCDRRTFDLLF